MSSVARACKCCIGKGFLSPVLPTVAGHCVRVRVKLGSSGVRRPWIQVNPAVDESLICDKLRKSVR